jgi:hypothetical protein
MKRTEYSVDDVRLRSSPTTFDDHVVGGVRADEERDVDALLEKDQVPVRQSRDKIVGRGDFLPTACGIGQLRAAGHPHLPEHCGHMSLGSPAGDAQPVGDGFVAEPLPEEGEHLLLPSGQVVKHCDPSQYDGACVPAKQIAAYLYCDHVRVEATFRTYRSVRTEDHFS